ncbi:hypothetical protein K504DRAFT_464660 [Pleomassaria siparia CBS 279.74]|uniref:Uncharacterized protein n=1 Tax=Pleomassaria siparia CBS 279.74 TaxID=1314801 RepID=A0A6G1KIY2_9PLEO|nr:hypothetical protein K504DRAFT_464660 [Pleomassaria siparia CBS 279.74]
MSTLPPLSPGAQDFGALLDLRMHQTNGRFYCGAPTQCTTLLSLEESLMWRETLEIWYRSKNLLDSAIYKWAASMLCDKHYGNEEIEAQLWESIKNRVRNSKYVRKNGETPKTIELGQNMATTLELRALEKKGADLEDEKKGLMEQIATKEDELKESRYLRNAAEQLAAQKEGALIELRCRYEETKRTSRAHITELEDFRRANEKRELKRKESAFHIQQLEASKAELSASGKEMTQRLDEANRTIAEISGSLKELRNENKRLSEQNSDFTKQLENYQREIARGESALKHAETKFQEQSAQNKMLQQSRDDAIQKLAEQDGALSELRRENHELRELDANKSTLLTTAQRTIGSQDNELTKLKGEMERVRTERDFSLDELSKHNEELIAYQRTLSSQVKSLQGLCRQHEDSLKNLHEDTGDTHAKTSTVVDQTRDAEANPEEAQKASLVSRLKAVQADLEQQKSANVDSSKITKEMNELQSEVSKARNEKGGIETALNNIQAELEAAKKRTMKLAEDNFRLARQLNNLEDQAEKDKLLHASTLEKAKKDLETSQLEGKQFTHDKSILSSQVGDLQERLEGEQTRYEALAKELDEWQAENEELSAAKQELENQLRTIKSKSAASDQTARAELEQREVQTQQAQSRAQEAECEKRKLMNQLQHLKAELDEAEARVAAAYEKVEHERTAALDHAALEAEKALNDPEIASASPSKRHSRIWRKISSHKRSNTDQER